MNDEIAALVGSPTAPLKRIRDKRKSQELRDAVAGDDPPHLRLRAALAGGMKPPDELLQPSTISQALRLDDCFKFLLQLSEIRRVVSAGSVLEAIRNLLRQGGTRNPNVHLVRCLKLSEQWEGNKNPVAPSERTINQYLSLVESIVEQPTGTPKAKKSLKKPQPNTLPRVLSAACRWATKYPGVDNTTIALRCVTAVERRERTN